MTLRTNGKLAGVAFLAYIAFGILDMVVFGRAVAGKGVAAKLATVAQHAADVRLSVVLSLLFPRPPEEPGESPVPLPPTADLVTEEKENEKETVER